MNIIGCLDRPTGSYWLNEQNLALMDRKQHIRNREIGIFQQFNLLTRANAMKNVMLLLSGMNEKSSSRAISYLSVLA